MTNTDTQATKPERVTTTIERIFKTTPQRLFEAWTDPELTAQWLAPGPMKCSLPVYEAHPGGRFHIEMSGPGPDGKQHEFAYQGTFVEVEPGKRIIMDWPPAAPPGEDGNAGPPSVVTITFTPVDGGTLMRLTQDGFPSQAFADGARGGWESAFDKMASIL